MNEEAREIIEVIDEEPQGAYAPAPLRDDQLLEVARNAEERIEAVNKIKLLVVTKMTNKNDWSNQGGKPYLWGSGAEKVGLGFGVTYKPTKDPVKVDLGGGHYRWEYNMKFTLKGVFIEMMGSRDSKDPFFSNKNGREVPSSEVDEGDVKKAAHTNCIARGVTTLLGIRNLSWEDLAQGGITPENVGTTVKYGKAAASIVSASEKQISYIDRLKGQCIKAGGLTEDQHKKILADPPYEVKEVKELNSTKASKLIGQYQQLLSDIEADNAAFSGGNPGPSSP